MKARPTKAFSTYVFATLLFVTIFRHSNAIPANDSLNVKIDALFAEWDTTNSPGCALAIMKDGAITYARGYGMANLEHRIPNSRKTIFRIGSTSKQFTAACMVLLAEQGKISLDDDIRKHLPEIPVYDKEITIRHLIHHTSGIRDYLALADLSGLREDDFYTDAEVVEWLSKQAELNFTPGDEHLYSNSGYFLLSQIVKRVTGASMRTFAEELIFKPLRMNNTHFHDDHTMIVQNRADGYASLKDGGYRISMTTLDMIGDGGIFTSVEDLALWDANFYNTKIGGQDFLKTMLTRGQLNNGEKLDYAFGLVHGEYKGLKTISHGGAFVGFRAQMLRFPGPKVTITILSNLSTFNPSRLAYRVADIYLADALKPSRQAALEPTDTVRPTKAELNKLTGSYWDAASNNVRKIYLKKGVPIYWRSSDNENRLSALGENRFVMQDVPAKVLVSFKPTTEGNPQQMSVVVDNGKPSVFEAFVPYSLSSSEKKAYTGTFYSAVLDVEYHITQKNDSLFVSIHKNPENLLSAIFKDTFQSHGFYTFKFKFDSTAETRVTDFTLHAVRVKNVRFVRR